jgi:hypothetical protein
MTRCFNSSIGHRNAIDLEVPMSHEECIAAGINPRHANNPLLCGWCLSVLGLVPILGAIGWALGL